MRRREFISLVGGAATAWPVVARAQQPAMPVIGFLSIRTAAADTRTIAAFRRGLNEAGFVEGQNIAVEYRFAEGQFDRVPSLVADLHGRRVAVIVTTGGVQAALTAKAATTGTPIVFTTGGDPVAEGLVQSLAHPGGNMTGYTSAFGEVAPKRLGLLREISPGSDKIGVLVDSKDRLTSEKEIDEIEAAARNVNQAIEVLRASTADQIDAAFGRLSKTQPLVVSPSPFFVVRTKQLVGLASDRAVSALFFRREFCEAGGLMSYGSDLADGLRIVGNYTGRIIRGEKPSDLPVQQPTKYELVINLRTARALGLIVPATLLARADEVIE